jgi:hypothetical protein
MILLFIQSACAANAPAAPTETPILDTATPAPTSTPTNTPTPEATATSTNTPEPTATVTPNVTATQIPDVETPVDGKGNLIGLVLWNDQPVPKAAVWLCEGFSNGCTGINQYRANTDANGYYVFKNVTPGKYIVAVNSFSTGWFIFYISPHGTREQTVTAGKDLILNPMYIWKFNMRNAFPKVEKVPSDVRPTFSWNAYEDAAYYQISLYDINFKTIVDARRVDGLTFTPTKDLINCRYYWDIEAFNADGIRIASTSTGDLYFYVTSASDKC